MVICALAALTEGNFALMNVNKVSFQVDLQNEMDTVKFLENSEHDQHLVNSFVQNRVEEKCPSLDSITNGKSEVVLSNDENELAKIVSNGGLLELESSNVILPTKEGYKDEAMLDTALCNGGLSALHISDRSNRNWLKDSDFVSETIDASFSSAPSTVDASINISDSLMLLDPIPLTSSNLEEPSVLCENDLKHLKIESLRSSYPSNAVSAENKESLIGEVDSKSSANPGSASDSELMPVLSLNDCPWRNSKNASDSLKPVSTIDSPRKNPENPSDSKLTPVSINCLQKNIGNPSDLELKSMSLNNCQQILCDKANDSGCAIEDVVISNNLVKELPESDQFKETSGISQRITHLEESVLNELPVKSIESIEDKSDVQITPSISHIEKSYRNSEDANSEIHSMNIQDYANLKVECSHYKSENEQLEHQLSNLQLELNSFKTQQAQLLLTIEQQEKQLKQINETAKRQQEVDARSCAVLKQELESQIEKLKQECETLKREREVSVMRYAKSEMDVIQLREKIEACQKKFQETIKERDSAQGNIRQLISDKTKYSQMYDNKCSEVRVAHNEIEQLKADLNSRNIKLKWAQNKLKEEEDKHKETQIRLDEVTSTIQGVRNEAEQAKLEAQASIKTFKESQENRAFVLDQHLKEEQAKLILVRAEKEDLEKKIMQLTSKLQQVEAETKSLSEKNSCLTDQLQSLEKEKLEMDVKLSTMQQLMNKEVQENVELESQLSEMRALRIELEQGKKKSEILESEAMKLRSSNAELLIDMDSCRKREAEMLEFTERLTAQNVKLQSDFSALQAKNEELEMEQSKINDLKAELEKEKRQRLEENKILARHVAEYSQRCEELSRQLAEQKSENVVLRRKNAATIRELTRELQQAKKHSSEHNSDGGGSGSNSLCQDSRASSCASLTDTSQGLSSNLGSITAEPDKQTLIERIVALQRRNAQYLERIEFLEEHNQEMTEELKKKTKIVQNFMLREPVGALSSNSMDSNKMALSKKGYMASLYSSKIKDKNMTLEKSLEICQTLHSLLEDTILKNITLKENMDTLGEEIARLRSDRTKQGES